MLQQPQLFSTLPIKRPSGLSFDQQGEHTEMFALAFKPSGQTVGGIVSSLERLGLNQWPSTPYEGPS
jgi:hypothetical protein